MSEITEEEFWNRMIEPDPFIIKDNFGMRKIWYNDQGQLHRENDLPGEIWYDRDGNIEREYFFKKGKIHRIGAPAEIWYNRNGNIEEERWYQNGIRQRTI